MLYSREDEYMMELNGKRFTLKKDGTTMSFRFSVRDWDVAHYLEALALMVNNANVMAAQKVLRAIRGQELRKVAGVKAFLTRAQKGLKAEQPRFYCDKPSGIDHDILGNIASLSVLRYGCASRKKTAHDRKSVPLEPRGTQIVLNLVHMSGEICEAYADLEIISQRADSIFDRVLEAAKFDDVRKAWERQIGQ